MEGENLYNISQERKSLRKTARDEKLPEKVSQAAHVGVEEIHHELEGLISRQGGIKKTKERYLRDKARAAESSEAESIDTEAAALAMREEAVSFRQALRLKDKLEHLNDLEMRSSLESKAGAGGRKARQRISEISKKEKTALEQQLAALERESPRAIRASELLSYKRDLAHEGHIALTPSVKEYLSRVGENLKIGKPMLLHGPTGSGKTSLARFAVKHFTGQSPEMVYCNPQTRESSVWGKTGIRPAKEGGGAMETVDILGPLSKAAKEGHGVVFDEFTALPQEQQVFIKGVFNAKAGDEITIVGNGKTKLAPGFQMIMTANLKSLKNPERQAMPPEIAREFEQNNLKIAYPPSHETYDIILARLLNPDGSADLSWYDLNETLPRFCEVLSEIQTCYQGQMSQDTARLTGTASLSGKAKGLSKLVLTPGTVEVIIDHWKRKKEEGNPTTLAEHLDERLKVALTLEEYPPEDRILAAKILSAKGFLRTLVAEDLDLPNDIFAFDAAKRHRGDENARAQMIETLKRASGDVKHLTLKELSDLDPFGIQAKRKERRLAALRAMLPPTETPIHPETPMEGQTTLERAKEIMGDHFEGPEAIKRVFGIDIPPDQIPPIPFPEDKLEQLKSSCRLILYAQKWQDGSPLTGKSIMEKFNNQKADATKLLYNADWYKNEDFFTKDTPSLKWRLVGDEVIPNSTNKNYLDQTKLLADFIQSQYPDPVTIPPDIKEMIEEAITLSNDPDFQAKVKSNDETLWKPATEKLSNLPLNQHFRESFPELFYRLILLDRDKAIQLLQAMYSWTNSRTSGGGLVDGGRFGDGGLIVYDGKPDDSYSEVGCVFSAEKF